MLRINPALASRAIAAACVARQNLVRLPMSFCFNEKGVAAHFYGMRKTTVIPAAWWCVPMIIHAGFQNSQDDGWALSSPNGLLRVKAAIPILK